MSLTLAKPSFSAGELAPSLWGRTDVAKWHVGASVMRNMYVSYRGGACSRAGTMWVGQCRQPASASSVPPRLIRFQFNIFQNYILEFGDGYMRVVANGAYVTDAAKAVTGATQANPAQLTVVGHGFANGDWVAASTIGGMTELNGRTFIVFNVAADTFLLKDEFGNAVNSLAYGAYTGGGTVARIFTSFAAPYLAADLQYLKVTQDKDVMSLTCVNQQTNVEYPAFDLERLAANNWTFTQTSYASSIAAPATCTAIATVATGTTHYSFVVTAIDAETGDESIASPVANVTNSVNIALVSGSLRITWAAVPGAAYYHVYQAPPAFTTAVPIGSAFGFIGQAFGTEFVNTNIVPDFTRTPPLHLDPFARGQVDRVVIASGGAAYVQATTIATITSGTGSGAVVIPVVVGGVIVANIIQNRGKNYQTGDVILYSDSGGGTGATATLTIGAQTGTYPSVASYFQQRRVYAAPLNLPDTYFMTQPGAPYQNMDASTPPVDDDAIVGTPWGQQVNGIQWLLPMPGGLIVATGKDAWQVSGSGGPGSIITPAQQNAIAQESNGFSPTVPPLKINFDIVYVQTLGSIIRDISYDFYKNIYTGGDISLTSNHLFEGFEIVAWAFSKEPNKLIWAARNDGKFISCAFLREQELIGWSRHDTNGLVVGVEVATEPPVDAVYLIVKRYIVGQRQWAYYLERMDNRLWQGPEDPWCVDCGLALTQPAPAATLSAASADGPGTVTGGYLATGGANYTNPGAQIIDPAGTGSGAEIDLTTTGAAGAAVVTGFTVLNPGALYSPGTYVVIVDTTGTGATLIPFVSQNVLFDASAPVFGSTLVGDVIRVGGGQAVVTAVNNPSEVLASITVPIVAVMPNDPNRLPVPALPGQWTITTPVTTLRNLGHLEGMEVAILADGAVQPRQIVANGTIALQHSASSIKVGLPFVAQLQTMHAEAGQGQIQGDRKNISSAVIRVEKSRGVKAGSSQPVASTLDFQQEIAWVELQDIPDQAAVNIPAAAIPLFTGDRHSLIAGGWYNWNGFEPNPAMLCVQQDNPLPMNILSMYPDVEMADDKQ